MFVFEWQPPPKQHRTPCTRPPAAGQVYEQAALPLQKKYLGQLIGFFVSEVGPLNQVVHLWGFDSLAERERRRQQMELDPGWALYRDALRDLDVILQQDTKLLKSVPFSPL